MSKKILIVGGAGYIGSHMTLFLSQNNYQVVVIDNLSTGFSESIIGADFIYGDIGDKYFLKKVFKNHEFDAVMHFAAFSQVGESIANPSKYYKNNVSKTLILLDEMVKHNVQNFIFSSTAATYGNPNSEMIDESHPQNPINPYGMSKLMVENILKDYNKTYGLKSISLRYFNACGADPKSRIGELHNPETHLIPIILQTASGRRNSFEIYGDQYDTNDGTCIRDYIHVLDLCDAHEKALNLIMSSAESKILFLNLGLGKGFSVMDVLESAKKVVFSDGKSIKYKISKNREGDPARLVADPSCAMKTLNWKPKFTDLDEIIYHAWKWEKKQNTK